MTLVVLTQSVTDPIAKTLKGDAIQVDIKTFLNEMNVFDKISDQMCRINWQHGRRMICNDSDTILLNRICYFTDDLVSDFDVDDQLYALMEIQAYFGFATSNFNCLNISKNSYGAEESLPLPNQWEIIKTAELLKTPDYYWGDLRFNHLRGNNLIYGSIYDFTRWRPNHMPNDKLQFCYERPPGAAYFALCIGDKVLVTPYDSKQSKPPRILAELAVSCARHLKLFISETLFFVGEQDIYFGFTSPLINMSRQNEDFSIFSRQAIVGYYREKQFHASKASTFANGRHDQFR